MMRLFAICLMSLFSISQIGFAQSEPPVRTPIRSTVFSVDVKKPLIPNDIRTARSLAKKYCVDYTGALAKQLAETLAQMNAKASADSFKEFCNVANEIIDSQMSTQALAAGLTSTQDRADFIATAELLKSIPLLLKSHAAQGATIASLQDSLTKLNLSQQGSKSIFVSLGVSDKSVHFVESILLLISISLSLGLAILRFK